MWKWFCQKFLSSPVVRAKALKWLRWASQGAGVWAMTSVYVFITTHVRAISTADAATIAGVVSTAVAGIILSVGSAVYSIIDANTVAAKIEIAAATNSTALVNDKKTIAEVKAASGTPEALQQTLAVLKAGDE